MKARILIADDSVAMRRHLDELIRSQNSWEICAAVENGREAVSKAVELKPDLILLDLAMPIMDGLHAAREIGKALPAIPIVVYTLHDSSWVKLEAKKAGVRRVALKTEPNEFLLSTIEKLLLESMQSPREDTNE